MLLLFGRQLAHWAFKSMRALPAAQASTATVFGFIFFAIPQDQSVFSTRAPPAALWGMYDVFVFPQREPQRENAVSALVSAVSMRAPPGGAGMRRECLACTGGRLVRL